MDLGGGSFSSWMIGAAALGAAAILFVALFGDRARGRKRCPKCWYDMSGAAGATGGGTGDGAIVCPECGKRIAREKELFRTRRRWGAVWLLVLLGMLGWWLPGAARRASARGVIGLTPTTALVVLVPRLEVDDGTPSAWADELRERCEKEGLASWQLRVLCESVLEFRHRRKATVGARVRVFVEEPGWLAAAVAFAIRVEAQPWRYGDPQEDLLIPVDRLGESATRLHIVAVTAKGNVKCEFQRTMHTEGVGTVAEAVEPVASAELNARIRGALSLMIIPGMREEPGSRVSPDALFISIDDSLDEELSAVALPLTVEFRRDGVPAARHSLMLAGDWHVRQDECSAVDSELPAELAWDSRDSDEMAKWTVLVRGEPERGMEDPRRTKVWAGEFEVPLTKVLGEGWE